MAEYAKRSPLESLEPYYSRHVSAMTTEGLHAKSDIAAELAYRDSRVAALEAELAEAKQREADAWECNAAEKRGRLEALRERDEARAKLAEDTAVMRGMLELDDAKDARIRELEAERDALRALIDTPHTADFLEAVKLEAIHQTQRWGTAHDDGKGPTDWFWILGYLAGKAVWSATHGDREKALHHTISSAAALLNWHAHMSGVRSEMRPGIADPDTAPKTEEGGK